MAVSFENRYVWLKGQVVHLPEAQVNILAPSNQFGLNVFEGIRGYWSEAEQQMYLFRMEEHLSRLKRSQRLLELEDTFTREELLQAVLDTIRANDYREDVAVRQTLFVDGFASWSASGPVEMFIAPVPKGKTSAEYNKKGLHCCVSSWQRIQDNVLSPRIKCGANYINSRMAQREALRNGYDTTIFLNHAGKVAEGPGSCLFIVREGKLITPALTDSVLESITRDTLLRLAADLGIPTEERSVDRTELYLCEEAFLCGSAMEVTAVLSVDRYTVGTGVAGEITTRLHQAYLNAATGKNPSYRHWLTPVYQK